MRVLVERGILQGGTTERVMLAVEDSERVIQPTQDGTAMEIGARRREEGAARSFRTSKTGDLQEVETRFMEGRFGESGAEPAPPAAKLK
jgi:hypothetical protein